MPATDDRDHTHLKRAHGKLDGRDVVLDVQHRLLVVLAALSVVVVICTCRAGVAATINMGNVDGHGRLRVSAVTPLVRAIISPVR